MDNQNKQKKTGSNGIVYGISIGMLVGVALGCWLDNLGLWMSVGIVVAVCIGVAADSLKDQEEK